MTSSRPFDFHFVRRLALAAFVLAALTIAIPACNDSHGSSGSSRDPVADGASAMIAEGRDTFRFDTFGDEHFWGDQLHLHQAIEGSANGGSGAGLTPAAALGAGLKVDSDAMSSDMRDRIEHGGFAADDVGNTMQLLRDRAIVGVTGFFDAQGVLQSIGIQCALCHSTVDDTLAPGMGHRRDGWANRDLNVGAIIALAPNLQPFADLLQVDVETVRSVLQSWGPGKFDAELILDGRAFQPDGRSAATLIPPAFGLAGVNLHTWTGWGSVTYWNAFVANLEMHGEGNFFDPRLDDPNQFPVAARARLGHVSRDEDEDRITPKLAALHVYQLALEAPPAPEGSFDPAAAERGDELFGGQAGCTHCHVEPRFTEPGWNLHTGAELCIDEFQASRAPDQRYRTTPLKGLWTHQRGGFFHDGRFATLLDVVNHYDECFHLGLTDAQKSDLVQYLLSI
jgi:hypothetical protein